MREKVSDERLIEIGQELTDLYLHCLKNSICISKGEFAQLIGVNPSGLSKCFRGMRNYACESTLARAKKVIREREEAEANKNKEPLPSPETFEPQRDDSDIVRLTKLFTEELRRQREHYERIIIALGGQDYLK